MNYYNPFVHEAATNLSEETISSVFIDNEHSRLIKTQKNIFVIGYRGSGKSMLLKYNSFHLQFKENKLLDYIGIYVSCQTPLFHKKEYELIDDKFKASILSEHIIVLSMATELLKSIFTLQDQILTENDLKTIATEIEFYFDLSLPQEESIGHFYKILKKELNKTQEKLNSDPEEFYINAKTFSSLIIPLIDILKETDCFKESHFMFMIDDAQMLSEYQQIALSSWISYRDTKNISFKIALTSKSEFKFYTNSESSILENHDYVSLDLEKDMFNESSSFADFAKKVLEKRLEIAGIQEHDVNKFFPIDEAFNKRLEEIGVDFIAGEYPELSDKTIEQRKSKLSKYVRAIYFRLNNDTQKANLPTTAYTGFKVLANLSTGVVRNLLLPCYKMYERERERSENVTFISSRVQYESIKNASQEIWDSIDSLPTQQKNCTEEDAKQLKLFLENFALRLKEKLINPKSTEKQILSFTIEDLDQFDKKMEIKNMLNIAIQAGLIYTRIGPNKSGGRTTWYTPNRLFWPSRGLDPVGQNGRMNIKSEEIFQMMNVGDKDYKEAMIYYQQKGLFDD
jgi:hypothetical protein